MEMQGVKGEEDDKGRSGEGEKKERKRKRERERKREKEKMKTKKSRRGAMTRESLHSRTLTITPNANTTPSPDPKRREESNRRWRIRSGNILDTFTTVWRCFWGGGFTSAAINAMMEAREKHLLPGLTACEGRRRRRKKKVNVDKCSIPRSIPLQCIATATDRHFWVSYAKSH